MQRENDILNINPSKPDGISHCYQLDQFISVLRVKMSGIFHFIQILIEQLETLTRQKRLRIYLPLDDEDLHI